MTDLTTRFAGLTLKNPFIVGSSGLTDSVEKLKKLEGFGAAAVVLKSIFEEQILYEAELLYDTSDYPEAEDYIRHYTKSNSLDQYLKLITSAKKEVDIPVIASINCVSSKEWTEFARNIETAGADAIELNVYMLPVNLENESKDYEKTYQEILTAVKSLVGIPVIMKLGPNFTHPAHLIEKLYHRGVDGVVLFNRFYAPDINIEELSMTTAAIYSSPSDISYTLRWVAIISSILDEVQIAASTGIHDWKAAVKQLLAGAQAIQICSALYKNGAEYLAEMIYGLETWMENKKFRNIDNFRGRMSYRNISDPAVYERSQFMKHFSSRH
jgi:dihydroorotate dehydrogenase (fumarate)